MKNETTWKAQNLAAEVWVSVDPAERQAAADRQQKATDTASDEKVTQAAPVSAEPTQSKKSAAEKEDGDGSGELLPH